MKKGWKAGWIIAGVAAVTGGMFCIAGVALEEEQIQLNLTESMFSTSFQGNCLKMICRRWPLRMGLLKSSTQGVKEKIFYRCKADGS